MPFYLYQYKTNKDGIRTYIKKRKISLAGKYGPIASFVLEDYKRKKEQPFRWHMSQKDILSKLEVPQNDHEIIIDLKPKTKGNVSLFILNDIWGFSSSGWTPILLKLESLFVDRQMENADDFKNTFSDENVKKEIVHEFLYLNGDGSGGKWTFGMVGFVNGALLWPDTLEFFMNQLKKL